MTRPKDVGYGHADPDTAQALKEGLERNGWIFDKFEKMKNGNIRFHYWRPRPSESEDYIHARFPPNGEGMWVKVDGRSESPVGERATGVLDNKPVDSPHYHYGQRVNIRRDEKEGWIAI